jgi:3-methylcrotonyl-CoA carboxylase alpha subunit
VFRKILIANRGEIACRVMRTARRMGIATVAVYSEADARSMHVQMADEAVLIGPAPVNESYLRIDRVIEAARQTGAEAVHPGYGFLSENAAFAEACAEAGLVFIGPSPQAIRSMGEKAAAKAIMEKAGVPVVPGYHGEDQSDDVLSRAADEIGYPVLIKAVAGGGGRGMRQVESADKFEAALKSARREAAAAFGDDKVLVEKYLTRPRHIEVQVFGDGTDALHLFERDCSIQRRHQKVIEEAPAPGMTHDMRRAMGEAAVAAARAIGYVGAGTVEFIADVSNGLSADAFYFMEMNTRLQVEHPVTEMITGQDLVEWQFRLAAGDPLPIRQDDLTIDGHAVEVRIYAENPRKKFFPSTGRLNRLAPPAEGPHLRLDTGVRQGDEVSIYYDPMIAKLIVWDTDRTAALRRLRDGLERYQIAGVANNIEFLAAVASHPSFVSADLDTGFIDRHLGDLVPATGAAPDQAIAAACLDELLRRRAVAQAGDPHSPWSRVDGWRLNDIGHDEIHFADGERELVVLAQYPAPGVYRLGLPGGDVDVSGELNGDGSLSVVFGDIRFNASVSHDGTGRTVFIGGRGHHLDRVDPMAADELDIDEGGQVASPLPGKVVQVLVEAGAEVQKGQPLIIVEAMKMEHTIAAPMDGVIEKVLFAEGDQVEEGVELVAFVAPDAD